MGKNGFSHGSHYINRGNPRRCGGQQDFPRCLGPRTQSSGVASLGSFAIATRAQRLAYIRTSFGLGHPLVPPVLGVKAECPVEALFASIGDDN